MEQDRWIETSSGNRIHKSCNIKGSSHILINGNTTISENCTLSITNPTTNDNDRNTISIGKFCFLEKGVTIKSSKTSSEKSSNFSIKIGNYNIFSEQSEIYSSAIGSRCYIGKNCTLGIQSVIHDCCILDDSLEIPAGYVIPPFSHVKKKPGKDQNSNLIIERLPESYESVIEYMAKTANVLGAIDRSLLT